MKKKFLRHISIVSLFLCVCVSHPTVVLCVVTQHKKKHFVTFQRTGSQNGFNIQRLYFGTYLKSVSHIYQLKSNGC